MKLSIALATYNGAAYLAQQLESFARQTRLPDELVVTDDNSTDTTQTVVEDFARRAPFPVRFEVNAERLGYNRNFERAVARCTGDIVFISDQDDAWFDHKLDTVARLFEARPAAMVVVNDQVIATPAGENTGSTVLCNVRAAGYSDAVFGPGCCTAIRRPMLELLQPFPGDDVPYDHWINIIPELLGARILCEEPLQNYRRHASNTTGSYFARDGLRLGTLVAGAARVDVRDAYRAKIAGNEVIAERIAGNRALIEKLGFGGAVDAALRSLVAEASAYADRLACLGHSRATRFPHVVRMLRGGTYTHFQGYRSALKDLVAP